MTYREAVLEGCKTTKQVFGHGGDEVFTACVNVAARIGAGMRCYDTAQVFPILNTAVRQCPACGLMAQPIQLLSMAAHLNDGHHWTREEIAAWVDTYEQPAETEDATVSPAAVILHGCTVEGM